jgi:hypothetical protein
MHCSYGSGDQVEIPGPPVDDVDQRMQVFLDRLLEALTDFVEVV